MKPTITVVYENDSGEKVQLVLPAKRDICPDCEGSGVVLKEGLRGVAFSSEEFCEQFDPDERHEYFRCGGIYDDVCSTCNGRNVILVIDGDSIPKDLKAQYDKYCEYEGMRANWTAVDRMTTESERRMGC
jgi:DnaJ-class molecular chaperone